MSDRAERLAALEAYHRDQVSVCTRCPLSEGRTQVVVGNGDPDADLMFVGEAPGYHEDVQGVPFVGASGRLLGQMLEGIGMTREDVFVANVLKCRPPGNRDPQPAEIRECEPHLFRQVALIRPRSTRVAVFAGSRLRVERGRQWGEPGAAWATVEVSPHASRHAIVRAVLGIRGEGETELVPFAFDLLLRPYR